MEISEKQRREYHYLGALGDFHVEWGGDPRFCFYRIKHPYYCNENYQHISSLIRLVSRVNREGKNWENQENNYPHTHESGFSEAKHPERKRNGNNQKKPK